MTPAPRAPILPLTSVRIFAALYVVLLHCFFWTQTLWTSNWLGRFIRNGYTAVGFFFTLSGFILAEVYLASGRTFDRRSFWTSRFARAYPLLFASLLLDFPRYVRFRGLLHGLASLLSEALLLQSLSRHFRSLNAPSWSLSAEAFFYLLFPALAFVIWRFKRPKSLLLALWLCAMLIPFLVTLYHPDLFIEKPSSNLQLSVELMPFFRIFEFLAGIALCALHHSVPPATRTRIAWPCLISAAAFFFVAIQFANHIPLLVMSDGFLLPVYALTILGLVNVRGWLQQLLSRKSFVLLGESSYAVYLLHGPIFDYCTMLHPAKTTSFWASYPILVFGLSIASFLWLERPVRKLILARATIRPAITLQQESLAN